MSQTLKPCLDCGEPTPRSRCSTHESARNRSRNLDQAFYRSTAWLRTRKYVLARDRCCLTCGSRRRLLPHHVRSRRAAPELALDPQNLMTLCHDCHVEYEGDLRAGRDSAHRRLVEHIAEQLLGTTPENSP